VTKIGHTVTCFQLTRVWSLMTSQFYYISYTMAKEVECLGNNPQFLILFLFYPV